MSIQSDNNSNNNYTNVKLDESEKSTKKDHKISMGNHQKEIEDQTSKIIIGCSTFYFITMAFNGVSTGFLATAAFFLYSKLGCKQAKKMTTH